LEDMNLKKTNKLNKGAIERIRPPWYVLFLLRESAERRRSVKPVSGPKVSRLKE